jgi:hypothetical protein
VRHLVTCPKGLDEAGLAGTGAPGGGGGRGGGCCVEIEGLVGSLLLGAPLSVACQLFAGTHLACFGVAHCRLVSMFGKATNTL